MSNTSLLGSFGGQGDSSLMFRNKIINGDMRIDQRNAGAAVTPAHANFTLDRWQAVASQTSKYSIQRSAVAPSGFTNSLLVTSLSAYSVGASEAFRVQQSIEGFNTADLDWGTANAKPAVISFWVRSSLTGTFGGTMFDSLSTYSFPFSYSISAANTWEYKTIVVTGPTSGTFNKDNTVGAVLAFSLGSGASASAAAGSWASGTYSSATGATSVVGTNGATLYITGVQLEGGPTATPFERRPIGTELALCQRYYEKSYDIGTKPGTAGVNQGRALTFSAAISTTTFAASGFIPYKVPKRLATTAIATYNGANISQWVYTQTGAGGTTFIPTLNNYGETGFELACNTASGLTIGVIYTLYGHWTADAEL